MKFFPKSINDRLIFLFSLITGILVIMQLMGAPLDAIRIIPDWVDFAIMVPLVILFAIFVFRSSKRLPWNGWMSSSLIVLLFFKLFLVIQVTFFDHIYASQKPMIQSLVNRGVLLSNDMENLTGFIDQCSPSPDVDLPHEKKACTSNGAPEFSTYAPLFVLAQFEKNAGNAEQCEVKRLESKNIVMKNRTAFMADLATLKQSSYWHLSPGFHLQLYLLGNLVDNDFQIGLQRVDGLRCFDA